MKTTFSLKKSLGVVAGAVAFAFLLPCAMASDSLQLQTFKTHSRLTLGADESVSIHYKNSGRSFEIFLSGLNFGDLGAPLGQESAWKSQFVGLGDARVEKVNLEEVAGGVKITGNWKFPQGAAELQNPLMETYDYRLQDPPRFVVDFWVKKGPTRAEVQSKKVRAERLATLKKIESDQKRRSDRQIASEIRKADSENVGKFCQEPLSENKDIFLPFYPVHEKVNFNRWFSVTTADNEFPYYEPKAKEKDAQYVRLALKLYREGNPALAIKTLDFMDKERPDSSYRLEMKFLRANALIKLGFAVEADEILRKIIAETKDTPVALHAAMYMAAKRYNEGAYLQALEQFMWLASNHENHRLAWVFHFGAAECLYELKQMDRAAKEYQWVAENAKDPKDQAESVLRVGDLTLQRFHYAQALAAYSSGIKHFEKESANFPQVFINRAEALYGLGEFDRAQVGFEDFLAKFPAHPSGWRATYRLAEIFGRKAPDSKNTDARKWFYETINRFPFSPGATLARLRLLPCGDHGGFDSNAQDRFFSGEAANFDGRGELSLAKYQDFRAISHVRTLITTNQEARAVDRAIVEIKAQRSVQTREILGSLLARLFRKHILNLLADGKKFEALSFYQEKLAWVPKDIPDVDQDYLLRLSQAASDLSLGKLAQQIAESYMKTESQGGRRSVAAESDGGLEDSLRSSERNFTLAKAMWATRGADAETGIRERLMDVKDESAFSYGKELLLSVLDFRAGNLAQALSHGLRAQLLLPTGPKNIDDQLRLSHWVADLEQRSGNFEVALQMFREVEKLSDLHNTPGPEGLAALFGIPSLPKKDALLTGQAEILEKMERWGEAAIAYSRAAEIAKAPNKANFGYARALLHTGEVVAKEKALVTLRKMSEKKDEDFWTKLAREALAEEKTRETVLGDAKEGKR